MTLRRRDALALAAAPALLPACARDDANTLRFWAMGREAEVAPILLRGFQDQHPDIRLRIETLPWTAAHEKLLTAIAGDATPDVAQMGNTWLPEMQQLGALEALDPWLAPLGIEAADHYAGIWATNRIAGQQIGLPWYVDTRLLFYRRDLLAQAGFAAPPQDWAQWRAALQALHEGPVPRPVLLPTNEFEPLLALALQQPEDLLRAGGRYGNFSGAGFGRALAFYLEIFRRGWAPGVTNNQIANLHQEFGRGRFAFYISGPWNIGEFKRRLPAELQSAWATAPLPGPEGPGASVAGGSSLVVFKRSRVKPLAAKLIAYLSRPEVQLQFYALTGNLPPRRSTWALPRDGALPLKSDPHASAFAAQLERVRPTPAVPEWERIAQEMQLAAARGVHEGSSAEQVGKLLDVRVDGILAKRRWVLERQGGT
jgi:multiple sugar transport system substrate-binding protein